MEDQSKYKFVICNSVNAPDKLKRQFGQYRYKTFKPNDPYAHLNHSDKTEFDKFDEMPTTIYVMAVSESDCDQELLVGTRILPTISEYELESPSWSYITNTIFQGRKLPKSAFVWESMRWAGVSLKRNERKIGDGLAMMGLYQAGLDYGFTEIFGVTTTRARKFMDRMGYTNYSITPLVNTGRDGDTLEINFQVLDDSFLRIATAKYRDALKLEFQGA